MDGCWHATGINYCPLQFFFGLFPLVEATSNHLPPSKPLILCILFSHTNRLPALFHHIHKSPLCPQHPASLTSLSILCPSPGPPQSGLSGFISRGSAVQHPSDVLTQVLIWFNALKATLFLRHCVAYMVVNKHWIFKSVFTGSCCAFFVKSTTGYLLDGVVPDFDGAVRAAGDEDLRVEGVPLDGVHRHGVGVVRLQELAGVRFGALTTKRPSQDWRCKRKQDLRFTS